MGNKMQLDQEAYLRNLCRIFDIPLSCTEPNPELALNILARMYLVPTIPSQADRRRALIEIRANLSGHSNSMSDFISRTTRSTAFMQELPDWFSHLNESTENLIDQYKSLNFGITALGILGVGSVAGAFGAGVAEASRQNSARAGAQRTIDRLAGRGPLVEEVQRRLATRVSPRAAGAVGVVVAIGGTLAYHHALDRMEEIRSILMHRFQNGEMTDDQFRDVFGETVSPENIKRYWEM